MGIRQIYKKSMRWRGLCGFGGRANVVRIQGSSYVARAVCLASHAVALHAPCPMHSGGERRRILNEQMKRKLSWMKKRSSIFGSPR